MNFKRQFVAIAFALLLSLSPLGLAGQSGTSSIQGTITDSSGAVIQGASVVLTSTVTGVVLNGTSDASGIYSFPSVAPGVYSLSISKDAFAPYKISQFNVIVGQHATENAALNVSSSASIVVDASGLSNLLDTDSNDLGVVIGPQSVKQLPLNNRNFLQLGLLSGAAQSNAGAANGSIAQTGHPGMSINISGNEPDYTMYVINGLQTLGSRAGNTSLNISTGAIDQFEVHYGFFMPDMGPNPGIVDVVTKSGGNHIHGEVYEFVRNNQMEARNYFSTNPTTGAPIAPGPYHQNQFGFDFGGPVLKDKLFYFVNYEGYRQEQSAIVNATVPTAAMFGGDFSGTGITIYDPTTYNPVTGQRQPFLNNKITNINPAAQALLAYYLSGAALGTNNVNGTPKQTLNSDQFMGRIDYNINTRNQIFVQGNWLNSPANSPGLFPGQGTSYPLDTELVNVGWNWTLSSNKVNELRLGGIRDSVYDEGYPENGLQQKLNITGTEDPNGVPGIAFTGGFSGFGASTGLIGNLDNVYQIQDGFNWLHGNHQIKFGAAISYLRTIQSSANANARGVFNFNDTFTEQFKALGPGVVPYTPLPNTGSSFADFLLGDLTSAQSIGMPRTHLRWTTADPYVQDTWKVKSNLTANIALAWFGATSPNPSGPDKNLIHGFDFVKGIPTFAALGEMNPSVYSMTYTNFAPRIGISYQPGALKNTVVRAGWGLYYTTQEAVNFQYAVVSQVITVNNAVSNVQPTPTFVLGVNAMPAVTVGQITQAQANAMTGPIQYLSQNQRSPYVSQWNLDIQHTFASRYLLDIAYLGNESHHLAVNWNPFDCSSPGSRFCFDSNNPYNGRFSYMQEVNSIGAGNYHALLVKFQRQFSGGLSFMANYTYSKALSASQEGSNGTLNQRRSCLLACDYGPTTYDVPQSLVISGVWELPAGRGRHFGKNMNSVLNEVVGGWDVDAIVTMQKGNPFTVTAPNNTAWSPGQIRANTYCNGRAVLANKDVRSNFNPANATQRHYWLRPQTIGNNESSPATPTTFPNCYQDPSADPQYPLPTGARAGFGTSGFDSLFGPGINNWDIGVHKDFSIYRQVSFTLRGEFFNAWNHAQFANPNSSVSSSTFGQITATQHDAREIQIGGTLQF